MNVLPCLPEVDHDTKITPIHFADDPDLDPDSGSGSGLELLSDISRSLADGS